MKHYKRMHSLYQDVVGHIGDGSSDLVLKDYKVIWYEPEEYQAGGIMAGELQGPGGGMDDLIQTSIEANEPRRQSPRICTTRYCCRVRQGVMIRDQINYMH